MARLAREASPGGALSQRCTSSTITAPTLAAQPKRLRSLEAPASVDPGACARWEDPHPVHCGIGSWGGRRLSLGDYVTGTGPRGRRPVPEGANVACAPRQSSRGRIMAYGDEALNRGLRSNDPQRR